MRDGSQSESVVLYSTKEMDNILVWGLWLIAMILDRVVWAILEGPGVTCLDGPTLVVQKIILEKIQNTIVLEWPPANKNFPSICFIPDSTQHTHDAILGHSASHSFHPGQPTMHQHHVEIF